MIPFTALLVLGATPEQTVQAFVSAFNAQDGPGMARQVVNSGPTTFPFGKEAPTLTVKLGDTKVNGDEATVEADVEFPEPRGTSKFHEAVHLRQIGGEWRIVPAPSMEGTKSPAPIAVFAMMIAHPQTFALAKKAAQKTADLSNVKQISLAVMMYASDHKDRLPPAKGFKAAVMPYLRDADAFTAPGAPKGTVSYFLDPRLAGVVLTSIPRPAETAMVLEGTPAKTAFPWSGQTPLGYADGHVKMADAARVQAARKIPIK